MLYLGQAFVFLCCSCSCVCFYALLYFVFLSFIPMTIMIIYCSSSGHKFLFGVLMNTAKKIKISIRQVPMVTSTAYINRLSQNSINLHLI